MQRLSGDLKMPLQLDRELYRKDDSAVHEALREAGYTQFTIQLVPGQEAALADWARIAKAFA